MHVAAIPYGDGELEAREQDDAWTVRLANLEVRASYLDLALAKLLGNAPDAHRAAARLMSELADVVEQQESARSHVRRVPRREQRHRPRRAAAKPFLFGFRVLAFAVVTSVAFLITTWLTTFRWR